MAAFDPFRPMRGSSARLYVVMPLLMAAAAAASGLYVLFLARPFINSLNAQLAERAAAWLFFGTAAAGICFIWSVCITYRMCVFSSECEASRMAC